jgi:transcriptional regulator with XRE-family HTH domain
LSILKKSNGGELREIRRRLGWTQAVLAEKLGLDPTYISQLETGRAPLDEYYLRQARAMEQEVAGRAAVPPPPAEPAGAWMLRDEDEQWKDRALAAEGRLAALGGGLRSVMDLLHRLQGLAEPAGGAAATPGGSQGGPGAVSSGRATAEEAAALRAAEAVDRGEQSGRPPSHPVGGPSGEKSGPSAGTWPGSKARRPSPRGPAPK